MSQRFLQSSFRHESDLLAAVDAVRRRGWKIVDAYTPYAVHGLDRAMGLRPSRLPWVCLLGGLIGAVGMLWFEHWTMAIAWPVNVGGKPWNSLPSDAPVAFEAAVLLASSVRSLPCSLSVGCIPAVALRVPDRRNTDDRFVLLITQTDAAFDFPGRLVSCKSFDAVDTHEFVDDGGRE
ncbi:MAG: DUF3341 domain-containing protein [Planctomycetaceae bacterium]